MKLTIDIAIYAILVVTTVYSLLEVASKINMFFEEMYLDYDLSFDWDVVRQAIDDGTIDM